MELKIRRANLADALVIADFNIRLAEESERLRLDRACVSAGVAAVLSDASKGIYFVAETKGSMSSMDLRKIEESKINCARKFFAKITSDQVKYDVVNSYEKLMELVKKAAEA